MTLPADIDYSAPVPPLAELPASRAPWRLEASRAALLVHDLQAYFLRPFAPACPALELALASIGRLLRAARAAGMPVIYTAQAGDQEPGTRGLQGDLWGPGMTADPTDTAVVATLAPEPGDAVLAKHRYTAFAGNQLDDLLRERGRDQLVLTGVYAHIGITATAYDAFTRDVQPFVIADAVADLGAEHHARALAQIAACTGVVTTTADVLAALTPPTPPVDAGVPAGSDEVLRDILAGFLDPADVALAFARPDSDLFGLGLDSLRAFDLLDQLADEGVQVDFAAFTVEPTVAFLSRQLPVPVP